MSVINGGQSYAVIDSHVHTFPAKVAQAAVSKLERTSGITPFTDGTLPDTEAKIKAAGVDHAVLLNIATAPKQQASINRCAQDVNQSTHGFFTALGSVHFLAEDALEELNRIHEAGIPGIKLHPDYQNFMIDDERVFPIYQRCLDLGLIVYFHAGWDCYSPDLVHAPPEASRRVLDTFPKLKVVLAHFGGLRQWERVEKSLIGRNVWLDTAMCATFGEPEQMERLFNMHNPDRILLGSDCPWENPMISVNFILKMGLSPEIKKKILSENARRLFGITD